MARPFVSIFLPCYDQIAYIDEAIGSAVEQDYDALEVVVGDDGSTDGTSDRVREWARKHPGRVIPVLGPHVGITANCNRLLGHVKGKYVFGHAGDDVFLPGKVSAQVDWLESDDLRVMCGHAVEVIDADGGHLCLTTDARPLCRGRGARRMLDQLVLFPDISVAARRSAYPQGGYDERVGPVSAFKLNIDILAFGGDERGEYGYVDGVLARYRVHPESITRRSTSDARLHRDFLEGFLTALALTEASHPHLAASCRRARGRLLFSEARWHQVRHGDVMARRYFAAATRQDLSLAWKAAAGFMLSYAPAALRARFERHRRRWAAPGASPRSDRAG